MVILKRLLDRGGGAHGAAAPGAGFQTIFIDFSTMWGVCAHNFGIQRTLMVPGMQPSVHSAAYSGCTDLVVYFCRKRGQNAPNTPFRGGLDYILCPAVDNSRNGQSGGPTYLYEAGITDNPGPGGRTELLNAIFGILHGAPTQNARRPPRHPKK